jgi:hypothetical protein
MLTAAEVPLRLSTFRVDVTPPIGDGPCVGCMPKVASIEHPLELRGIVLRADKRTFVISAIDFCGICNTSDSGVSVEEIAGRPMTFLPEARPTLLVLVYAHF